MQNFDLNQFHWISTFHPQFDLSVELLYKGCFLASQEQQQSKSVYYCMLCWHELRNQIVGYGHEWVWISIHLINQNLSLSVCFKDKEVLYTQLWTHVLFFYHLVMIFFLAFACLFRTRGIFIISLHYQISK